MSENSIDSKHSHRKRKRRIWGSGRSEMFYISRSEALCTRQPPPSNTFSDMMVFTLQAAWDLLQDALGIVYTSNWWLLRNSIHSTYASTFASAKKAVRLLINESKPIKTASYLFTKYIGEKPEFCAFSWVFLEIRRRPFSTAPPPSLSLPPTYLNSALVKCQVKSER
jgi:hypothetical protein